LRKLAEGGAVPARSAPAPVGGSGGGAQAQARAMAPVMARAAPVSGPRLETFAGLVALAREKRDVQLLQALERQVRPARFEPGRFEFSLVEGASPALAQELTRKLADWTGERWLVALVQGATGPTLAEQAAAREAERLSGVAAHPLVRKVMEKFPGAKIVDIREPDAPAAPPPAAEPDADVAYGDEIPIDEDF